MSETDEGVENISEDVTTEYESETTSTHTERTESETIFGEEEEVEEESEESFYDPEDFISGPSLSLSSTLDDDILTFDFSYGYDCRKYFNLTVLDETTLLFSSGNFINFFDVNTKHIWFKRSALGGGIGHIRKNPNDEYPHLAVAECGRNPIIILYECPDLEIVGVLRGGAEKIYSNIDFSPDGELLVSQSGEPDYLITIWNWKQHKILLRTKSYVNEVFRVKFSPYVPGQLTTCGMSHIKFWKMALTFTGLKLKGELGRFGKTEYSDIIGVLPMPDAKVVSGSSWGNILIWDAGLITFEIFRTLRRKCHDAPIVQFYYFEGELWTVSMDGHVKIWWYEKIDQADPPDDDRVVLVDPSYDFYTPGLMLMSIEKRRPRDPSDTFWYAQDGNGGISLIDLNADGPKPTVHLLRCHGGKVVDIAASPNGPFLASLGEDGRLFIYSYLQKNRIFDHKFPAKGVAMLWLPLQMIATGDIMLLAFDDGQIRVIYIQTDPVAEIKLIQHMKPHHKKITAMSLNPSGTLLVSAGEDSTIFIFKVNLAETANFLIPIGYVPTPDIVNSITWHYQNENTVLVGCVHGQMIEVDLPTDEQEYTGITFKLYVKTKEIKFMSYKSQIRRNIKIHEIEERKAIKVEKKKKEMEKIKKDNPGLEIDQDAFLADSDTEEELEPLYIPEVANKIIWLKYTEDHTIWVSMGGYDAGYIYEYTMDQKGPEPRRYKMVDDADDIEISSYVYSHNHDYLMFAMQDGRIRVNKVNKTDFRDLSDYFIISMHDNQNGFVPRMCFSYDEKYFFTCGHDGNIFSYQFRPKNYTHPVGLIKRYRYVSTPEVHDTECYVKLSLEQTKVKAEDDRVLKLANQHKGVIRQTLKNLKERYKKLLQRNENLMESQVIPKHELELDERVLEHVKSGFQEKLDIVKRKLAYDVQKSEVQLEKLKGYYTNPCDKLPVLVKGINKPGCDILTVRQRLMSKKYYEMFNMLESKLKDEEEKGRPPERITFATKKDFTKQVITESTLEYFLLSLSPSDIELRLGPKLQRVLYKYRERKEKWSQRNRQWEQFWARKPVAGKNHPDDEKYLEEAKCKFGDYKLKENPNYKIPREERVTTVKQYKKLLETRGKQYKVRHDFIQRVYDIRDTKYKVIELLKEKRDKLDAIHKELPEDLRKAGPPVPERDPNEFPHDKLEIKLDIPLTDAEIDNIERMKTIKPLVKKPDLDTLECYILNVRDPTINYSPEGYVYSSYPNSVVNNVHEMTLSEIRQIPDHQLSPLEACLFARRLTRKLFMQKVLIFQMHDESDKFNKIIQEARKVRLPNLIDGNYIDIFILCLNEELNILKSFESNEDQLAHEVNNDMVEVHCMEDRLEDFDASKKRSILQIEDMHVETQKILEQFKSACESSKFYGFLKKVFKKKFKPPKVRTEGDSSSSSSSSSSDESEEDDDASIDSRDFGVMKQDLNVCPKGCESSLFNLTVELRTKRQKIEQLEKEELRMLELVKKDIELGNRKMTQLQKQLQASQLKLESFQREKQNLLNQVKCTVVLNLDQIYQFNPESSDISDFLVFSRTKLTELYKRVGELQRETNEQQNNHDTYLKHLMRLEKDMKYMHKKIYVLKQDIVQLMKNKFGRSVDINELEIEMIQRGFQKNYINDLEEVVLKKLVYELRIKMSDIKAIFTKELNRMSKQIAQTQDHLSVLIRENTNRLQLLTLINHEKQEMAKLIALQETKREKIDKIETIHGEFVKELQKLEDIVERQNRQIRELKDEIRMLKMKGLPPQVLQKRKLEEHEEEDLEKVEEIEELKDWILYDEFLEGEMGEEEIEEKISTKEITIPIYVSIESQDIVSELLNDLLSEMDKQLTKRETENIVREILSGILKCTSVVDILNEIIDNLPFEPSDDQHSQIGLAAEKLYGIQEPQVSLDSLTMYIKDILDETLYTVVPKEPHEIVMSLVEMLVENLPIGILTQEEVVDEIILKMVDSGNVQFDRAKLKESLDRMPIEHKNEMREILNLILQKVYGEGIDLLYVVN